MTKNTSINNNVNQIIFPPGMELRKVKKKRRKNSSGKKKAVQELKVVLKNFDVALQEAQKQNISVPERLGRLPTDINKINTVRELRSVANQVQSQTEQIEQLVQQPSNNLFGPELSSSQPTFVSSPPRTNVVHPGFPIGIDPHYYGDQNIYDNPNLNLGRPITPVSWRPSMDYSSSRNSEISQQLSSVESRLEQEVARSEGFARPRSQSGQSFESVRNSPLRELNTEQERQLRDLAEYVLGRGGVYNDDVSYALGLFEIPQTEINKLKKDEGNFNKENELRKSVTELMMKSPYSREFELFKNDYFNMPRSRSSSIVSLPNSVSTI